MSNIVLNSVFNDWINGNGVVNCLTSNFDVPWKNFVDGDILDIEYHGNRSGNKIISPLLENFIDETGISQANAKKICSLIYHKNIKNWTKLWNTLVVEYNPIENYNMTESSNETSESNGNSSLNDSLSHIGNSNRKNTGNVTNSEETSSSMSDKKKNTGTINNNVTNSNTNQNELYGFNSSFSIPSDRNNGSNTETNKTTNDITETVTGSSNENKSNTLTNNLKEENSNSFTDTKESKINDSKNSSNSHELSRKGNIGITTTQAMITQERVLCDWDFFNRVYDDIDGILVTNLFGDISEISSDIAISTKYILPIASSTTLGGVKPVDKTELMKLQVGVDKDGKLWALENDRELVLSVNGKTGDVKLTSSDIGSVDSDTFNLFKTSVEESLSKKYSEDNPQPIPKASYDEFGVVKIGNNLYIDKNGFLNAMLHEKAISNSNFPVLDISKVNPSYINSNNSIVLEVSKDVS